MADFSIKILPAGNTAGFQPDLPGREIGDPLYAPPTALVTWANLTADSIGGGAGFTTGAA